MALTVEFETTELQDLMLSMVEDFIRDDAPTKYLPALKKEGNLVKKKKKRKKKKKDHDYVVSQDQIDSWLGVMGSLLSKEGSETAPSKEAEPKSSDNPEEPANIDSQVADKQEDVSKPNEIKSMPTEDMESNEQKQETVNGGTSKEELSKVTEENLTAKEDDQQIFNSHDVEKSESNETIKESNKEVKSASVGEDFRRNDSQGNLSKSNNGNRTYAINQTMEPVITWRTPVDDPDSIAHSSKPRIGISEESLPEPFYMASTRAAKTPASYIAKPVRLNYDKSIPLSFVWTVPTGEEIPQKQEVKTSGAKENSPYLDRGNSRQTSGAKENSPYSHKGNSQQTSGVKENSLNLDRSKGQFTSLSDTSAATSSVDIGKQVLPAERPKSINTKDLSAIIWTIPNDAKDQANKEYKKAPISDFSDLSESHRNSTQTQPKEEFHDSSQTQKKPVVPFKFDIWWPSGPPRTDQFSSDFGPTSDALNQSYFRINLNKHIAIYQSDDFEARKNLKNSVQFSSDQDDESRTISTNEKPVPGTWNFSKRKHFTDYMDYLRGYGNPSEDSQPSLSGNSQKSEGLDIDKDCVSPSAEVVSEERLSANNSSQEVSPAANSKSNKLGFDPIKDPVPYSKRYFNDMMPVSRRERPVKLYNPPTSAYIPGTSSPHGYKPATSSSHEYNPRPATSTYGYKPATSSPREYNQATSSPHEYSEKPRHNPVNVWTPGRNIPLEDFGEVSKEDVLSGLKLHQEMYKLSPPPDTGIRRYPRRGSHTRNQRGYRNYRGRSTNYTGNASYRNRADNYHSRGRSFTLKRYESPPDADNNSHDAPELVDIDSIRHEHFDNDGSLIT